MLKNDFYKYALNESTDSQSIEAQVQLDLQHPIFQGHFPGQPVLPGACQVHIIKEILTDYFQQPLKLKHAREIKFISMLDLEQEDTFSLSISYDMPQQEQIQIKALLYHQGDQKLTKIRATFE